MQAKELSVNLEQKKADLFEQAHRNPELKRQLLKDPKAIAEKWDVKLEEEEIQALKKLEGIVELSDEIVWGRLYPPPEIFYPAKVWKAQELLDILSRLVADCIPAPTTASFTASSDSLSSSRIALHPEWVTYPARLRNILKDRIIVALGIKETTAIR